MEGQKDSASPPLALFDFEKAVAIARADFPEETKNITFIDLSQPDAAEKLVNWMQSTDPAFREKYLDGDTMEDFLSRSLRHRGFGIADSVSGTTVIASHSKPSPNMFVFGEASRELAYVFCHELGHAIVKNGVPRLMLELTFKPAEEQCWELLKQVNLAENVADSFASIYGVAKSWLNDAGDLGRIGFYTTMSPWIASDLTHFTSIAIDQLALDFDKLKVHSLSPAEIKAIAARHAEEFSPAQDSLMQTFEACATNYVSADYREKEPQPGHEVEEEEERAVHQEEAFKTSMQKTFENLARAYVDGPRNTLLYYIAHRTLHEVVETGRLENLDRSFDVSGSFWDKVRSTMQERKAEETQRSLLDSLARAKEEITKNPVELPAGMTRYTPAGHAP
jgi:hypothetical protein